VTERPPPQLSPAATGRVEAWEHASWVAFPMGTGCDEPTTWLGPAELTLYRSFTYPLRAREWLAGRWAMKFLLKAVHGWTADQLEILPGSNDAPRLFLDGRPRDDFGLSISHTHAYAAAAVAPCPVGIDVCDLQDGPRIQKIAYRVFNEGEAERTGALETDERGAAVWALKEAALKLDQGGVFQPGARSIEVASLDPVALANPGLTVKAFRLPLAILALAGKWGQAAFRAPTGA